MGTPPDGKAVGGPNSVLGRKPKKGFAKLAGTLFHLFLELCKNPSHCWIVNLLDVFWWRMLELILLLVLGIYLVSCLIVFASLAVEVD